jgi:F-type H+-transporting ATPase subunit b
MLLAALPLAALVLFGWVGTAHAQEDGGAEELDEESVDCIEILEDGGEVDDCHEAPSPILPETNEIIWGGLSFAILLVALGKFAYPPLKQSMDARSERIRDSLAEADKAKGDAEEVLADYQRQLADARNESARIIEEARQTADSLRRDLQQRAEADIAEMRQRAGEEIEAAKDRALAEVRTQVAELAIGAAERVVERNLDRDTNRALVESFIQQVGSRG